MLVIWLFTFTTFVLADVTLGPVLVTDEENEPLKEETDPTKILVGKKSTTTSNHDLPPVQTDNGRQFFSQQPSLNSPEQATEPWTAINFRGLGNPQEGQHVLILQDGLPVGLDMYGAADHYYLPPSPLMEKTQVIAGGGALLYGPQATAAINYLTPELSKGMKTRGRINAAGGSYNLLSSVNSLTGSSGDTSYFLGYYRKQGDGLQRTNGDFSADYVQVKTKTFLTSQSAFKTSLQAYDSDFGMPGGMSLKKGPGLNTWGEDNRKATRENNRLRVSRAQVMLGLEKRLSEATFVDTQVWSSAYRKYNKTQTGSGFGKIPTGSNALINTSTSYALNGEIRLRHEYDQHTLSLGYLSYTTNSPFTNERGAGPASNHGETTSRLYQKTRANAFFLENHFLFERFSVVPGVRFENINLAIRNEDKTTDEVSERRKSHNVVLGGLGLEYSLTPKRSLFANASQGFKPIGYETVLSQGNPNYTVDGDIKPSYNYFYETGIKEESERIDWSTSVYLIHRQNILASSNTVISNGSSAQYQGLEASALAKSKSLDFYLNTNLINGEFRRGEFKGKTPGHMPSAMVKYGLIYRNERKLKVSLLATHVNEHFSDDAHTDAYKVPSYTLYDLLAEYSFSGPWSLNGAVNNILDREYYARVMPTGVMPTMGRNFYLGVSHRF